MALSILPFAFAFLLWTWLETVNDDYGLLPNQVTLEVPDPEEAYLRHYLLLHFPS
jgi:hypothetical protein